MADHAFLHGGDWSGGLRMAAVFSLPRMAEQAAPRGSLWPIPKLLTWMRAGNGPGHEQGCAGQHGRKAGLSTLFTWKTSAPRPGIWREHLALTLGPGLAAFWLRADLRAGDFFPRPSPCSIRHNLTGASGRGSFTARPNSIRKHWHYCPYCMPARLPFRTQVSFLKRPQRGTPHGEYRCR